MMNIMLQVAGFFVMIVIFIFYFDDRKAAVKSNKLFLYQAITIFVSIVIDIASIIAINTPALTYSFLSIALGKMYLCSVIAVACMGLQYVLNDAGLSRRKYLFFKIFSAVFVFASAILALSFKLDVIYDPEGMNDYTAGWPVTITYISTFTFMAITIIMAIVKRKVMYRKRFIGVCIFLSLWVIGSGAQALFNYLLVDLNINVLSVSFAEALGSLVIYIMLENPSLNLDRVTETLTQRAFEEFIDDCYKKKLNPEFVLIDYDNNISSSIMGYNKFSKAIARLLREFNVKKIFKNDRNNFIAVRNDLNTKSLMETVYLFKEQLYRRNNIKSEIPFKIIYFRDLSYFYGTDDLMDSIDYLVNNLSILEKDINEVTQELADKIHSKFVMKKKCDVAYSTKNVEVYLQPIYSNANLSFTAAEALVRLKDTDGNLIYPGDFIEDFEKDGRIVELGKYVFEDVCKFISENDMEKLGLKYIEVNLSTIQCMQDNLASSYINIMEKYRINPKYINLEITETAQSTKITLLRNMEILRQYGVSFSLDDFGTGNSNLNYIVDMPVEIVKFDKSMVNSYFENKIASFVMNSTIDMIKGLGQKIVFEGIETEEQINLIKGMKVDYIQGYFYSKPIDKVTFVEFILSNNKIS